MRIVIRIMRTRKSDTIEKNVVRIAVARGSGVVKGTAHGSTPHIGAVAPMTDLIAITRPCCILLSEEPSLAEVPSVAEHRIPNLTSDTEIELPLPLRHLISSGGVKLVSVPDNTWNINGHAGKLRRTLSVSFSVDSAISGEEVLEVLQSRY